ncbi:MAG: hypothetical protein ACTS9Y_00670 [Methylophilus sp.]|uniref:hypothetical protein n=1 Tax=Methylophilus sp. TaxID=29541 RepID=UPI003FA0CC07
MNIQKAQEVIEDIELICIKHGVSLVGGNKAKGVYGEIQIIGNDDLTDADIAHIISTDSTNKSVGLTISDSVNEHAVIHDLEQICKKHSVALIGGSLSGGFYGEIQILVTQTLNPDDIDHLSSGNSPYKTLGRTVVNGVSG